MVAKPKGGGRGERRGLFDGGAIEARQIKGGGELTMTVMPAFRGIETFERVSVSLTDRLGKLLLASVMS